MKFYEQAQSILAKRPLPDDAPQQLDALADKASGMEQQFIIHAMEALTELATPEQLILWSPDDKES